MRVGYRQGGMGTWSLMVKDEDIRCSINRTGAFWTAHRAVNSVYRCHEYFVRFFHRGEAVGEPTQHLAV